MKYDDVMNKQRTVIYEERQAVLQGEDIHPEIERFIEDTVDSYIKGASRGISKPTDWDWAGLSKALNQVLTVHVDLDEAKENLALKKNDAAVKELKELIVKDAQEQYDAFEKQLGKESLRQLERKVVLAVLDAKWREHLYEMDYLKDGIGLRGMGQRDPLVEYQREGYQMFNSMIEAIKEETVQLLFHLDMTQVARANQSEADAKAQELDDDAANEAAQGAAQEAVDEALAEHDDAAAEVSDTDDSETSAVADADDVDEDEDAESDNTTDDDADSEGADTDTVKASTPHKSVGKITGPAPISHADRKVPVSKRPKNEELKTPWADGRTFPGTGRNATCPCGSDRKYKMCHGQNE